MAELDPISSPQDPNDSAAALAALGLTLDRLAEARERAQHDVDECTALDPPGARGHIRHIRTVRYLREVLIPHGWTADDGGNIGAVVSPDDRVSIVVTSGDAATGRHGHTPRTKYPKGELTWRRVRQNQQLSLFDDGPATQPDDESVENARQTWVLLQYPAGDVVRAELSCPEGVDDSGRINKWSERILLPDLPLDTHEAWEPGPDDEGYDSVDVPVSPR
ncbi:MAG: hypothetical protein DCC48_17130 [Acidobacteria bacterium]|nr:MAG: hypothetical protein DCC48_17130 [Acidobacteriota bacterium]